MAENLLGKDRANAEKKMERGKKKGRPSPFRQAHPAGFHHLMIVPPASRVKRAAGLPGLVRERPRRYNRTMQIRIGRFSLLLLLPFFAAVCASPPHGIIILCAGDSLTSKAYPHILQRLLNKDGIPARVFNYGVTGNTSGEYLAYVRRRETALQACRPDFILLQLGTNDVRTDGDFVPTQKFVENMKELIAFFKTFRTRTAERSRIFLALVPPIPEGVPAPFSPQSAKRAAEEINPAIRALSREENVPLVDNFTIFAGRTDLLPGVHPTREGFRLLAESWYEAIKPDLKK
jgi:lysophospholipase L1-like esterase